VSTAATLASMLAGAAVGAGAGYCLTRLVLARAARRRRARLWRRIAELSRVYERQRDKVDAHERRRGQAPWN
jgi:hypothetical protein